jgi:hypothetical protein
MLLDLSRSQVHNCLHCVSLVELAGIRLEILILYYSFLYSLRLCWLESHTIIRTKLRVILRLCYYFYLGASFQLFIFLMFKSASAQNIDSKFLKTFSEWIVGVVCISVNCFVIYRMNFITLVKVRLYIVETSLYMIIIWVFFYYI